MKNILKKYIYYRTYYLSLCKKIFSYSNHPLVSVIIPVYNIEKYLVKEQKDPVVIDYNNLNDLNVYEDNLVKIIDNQIHHDVMKLALTIYSVLL